MGIGIASLASRLVNCNIKELQKNIKSESGYPGFKDLQDVSLHLNIPDFCDN